MASGTIKNNSKSIIQTVVSYTYTLSDMIAYGEFAVPTIDGYSFIGVVGVGSNHWVECFVNAWPTTRISVKYGIRDCSGGAISSITVYYYLLYVRSDLADYRI